jgi:hypothetical protein
MGRNRRRDYAMTREQYLRDRATYSRLRAAIDLEYPEGWFVAIADDKVICAAETAPQLVQAIREMGREPRDVGVAEVGKDYPEYVHLFSPIFILPS